MKVSIIGQGRVGSTLAYTVLTRGLADEIVVVDRLPEVSEGEALDLQHAEGFVKHSTKVRSGEIPDTAGSDILVLTCSAPWQESYTSRFDLGRDNLKIFGEIVPPLALASPNAKVLVVSNPVDVMTYHAIRLTGFGPRRVFGSGTLIDSGRFRAILSRKMGIHPDDLRAYILGEHGDSQFPLFSMATVGGSRIVDDNETSKIAAVASRAGSEVVQRKGHTNFAVSLAAAMIIEAIVRDTRRTMPLSVMVEGFQGVRDVCLSLPVVMGKHGIAGVLEPELGPKEVDAFLKCADIVRTGIHQSLQ